MLARMLTLCAICVAAKDMPAFQAVMTEKGMQAAVDTYLPEIIKHIKDVKIPDVNGKKASIEYHVKNIRITTLTYGGASVDLTNSLGFKLHNLHVHVALDWSFRESVWPHIPSGHGSCDVDANNVNADVAVSAGYDGNARRPILHVAKNNIELGSVSIKVHGGILGWFLDIIIDLFKNAIKKAAEKAIETGLTNLLNVKINEAIASLPWQTNIDQWAKLDYAMTEAPSFPAKALQMDFLAAFMARNTNTPPNLPHHPIPHSTSGRMVDLIIDAYLFNSGTYTYFTAGLFKWLITPKDLPPNSPIKLNTTDFLVVFPLLYTKYPNRLMQIQITSQRPPTLGLNRTEETLDVPLWVTVFVDETGRGNYRQAFTLDVQAFGGAEFAIRGVSIYPKVDELKFSMKVHNSTIGNFDENIFNLLVQTGINLVVIPIINKNLEKGIPLPHIKGLQFINPVLKWSQGRVEVASDLKFDPTLGVNLTAVWDAFLPTLNKELQLESNEPVAVA